MFFWPKLLLPKGISKAILCDHETETKKNTWKSVDGVDECDSAGDGDVDDDVDDIDNEGGDDENVGGGDTNDDVGDEGKSNEGRYTNDDGSGDDDNDGDEVGGSNKDFCLDDVNLVRTKLILVK